MPNWLQVLFASSTPTIAIFGAYIAYQQWRLGSYKLKHDLFEKRWAVYAAIHDAMQLFPLSTNDTAKEAYQQFQSKAIDAQFLFSSKTNEFIDEIKHHLNMIDKSRFLLKTLPEINPERASATNKNLDSSGWILDNRQRLAVEFREYLDLSNAGSSRKRKLATHFSRVDLEQTSPHTLPNDSNNEHENGITEAILKFSNNLQTPALFLFSCFILIHISTYNKKYTYLYYLCNTSALISYIASATIIIANLRQLRKDLKLKITKPLNLKKISLLIIFSLILAYSLFITIILAMVSFQGALPSLPNGLSY